ncbi:MAG: hypothetical protein ACR2P2_05900 [Nakamurella sp.]
MTNAKIVRRKTARVLPIDADGRILLMHGWDPAKPESPFWFTIGGAIEPGRTCQQRPPGNYWRKPASSSNRPHSVNRWHIIDTSSAGAEGC